MSDDNDKTEKPPRQPVRERSEPRPQAPAIQSLIAVDYKPDLVEMPAVVVTGLGKSARARRAARMAERPTRYAPPAPIVFGFPDGSTVALTPGINLIEPKVWSVASGHKPIAALIQAKQLGEVDLDALSPEARVELISRTTSRAALESLMAVENEKPVTAGPARRRNPEVVEALRRKIARAPQPKRVQKAV